MNTDVQKTILDEKLISIKRSAMEAYVDPDAWVHVESSILDMINTVAGINPSIRRSYEEYAVQKIATDMLLSFLVCMRSGTDPISIRVINMFDAVDKKWVGEYDEDIAGSIVEVVRNDVIERTGGFSLRDELGFILGLVSSGYLVKYQLNTNFEDVLWFKNDLLSFLLDGTYMDSDEHGPYEFKRGAIGDIFSDINHIVKLLQERFTIYVNKLTVEIYNSGYNHNNSANKEFAISNMIRDLQNIVMNTLVNGDLRKENVTWLATAVVDTSGMNRLIGENEVRQAVLPIVDMTIRAVVEAHVMNGHRIANTKTAQMIWDTISLRRVLINERLCINNIENPKGL